MRYKRPIRETVSIGGLSVIFYDLLRLVNIARADLERYGRSFWRIFDESFRETIL